MNYVYPKFPMMDLWKVRLGGCGLGNLLFIYYRAWIYAYKNQYKFIWPTWSSIKIGPYIRHEKDKRRYNDLFKNDSGYIDGLLKLKLLLFNQKSEAKNTKSDDNIVYIFNENDFCMSFNELKEYRDLICEDIIRNLKDKALNELCREFKSGICAHIRLGDFAAPSEDLLKKNVNNISTPIQWYIKVINKIREESGRNITVYIFSDGTEQQLADIAALDNVKFIDMGTSIGNILALSNAGLLLASGSSFSMWARFIGNVPTIAYTNQLKEKIHTEGLELEISDSNIPQWFMQKIKNLY